MIWIFVVCGGRGGWMETEGYNNFLGAGCLYAAIHISRGRFWARFGTVGIVGPGWIIVDLSRCKLK